MKKKQIYLIFAFLLTNLISGQKVTLIPTVVNGVSVSSGPINLASVPYSTILLVADVEIPANVSVGDQGTLTIYFSKATGIGSNVSIGGNGGALYFGGVKKVSRNFTINLNWTDFSTSGGYIYCEYKNKGISFKSPNISVIKNSTVNDAIILNPPADAPNPNTIVNTLCCDQTIRLGDKPTPITGSQYSNPYGSLPYGINSRWNINNGNISDFNQTKQQLYLDYTTELKDINISRELGYLYDGKFPNKSNTIKIKIVPSPIISNVIRTDLPSNTDGFSEFSSSKGIFINGDNSMININILQNPFYTTNQPYYSNTPVDKYVWEYTILNKENLKNTTKNWTTINNENGLSLKNFNPSIFSSIEDQYFLVRRIATYQNISNASNELKLMTRAIKHNNTICCDQTLKINSLTSIENPSTITGSTPIYSNPNLDPNNSYYSISYQWQSQRIYRGINNWSDINGATSADYLPLPLVIIDGGRRGSALSAESTYNYRRIAKFTYTGIINGVWSTESELSYSNEVNLSAYTTNSPLVKIYPNPTSSILNIESSTDLSNAKIIVTNTIGNIVNSNNFSKINSNLISIDTSNLINGTYFIKIETQTTISQLIFIKK